MKCSSCRKEININECVKIGTDHFCNNLCKYNFQRDKSAESDQNLVPQKIVIPEDLKFHIDLPNFKFNKLVAKGSHYGYPKLFLNDRKLKPYRGKWIFFRTRKYKVSDDDENINEIHLRKRLLDAVPGLKINGGIIEIVPRLKWYQYLWISIPLILFSSGGIGSFLGMLGTLTNSVIFRKFNSKIAKYLLTAVNSFVAFLIFFKVLFFIWPVTEDLTFKYLQFPKAEISNLSEINKEKFITLTSQSWQFLGVYDLSGKNVTPANIPIRNSKRYFYENGKFSQILNNGLVEYGTWQFTTNFDSINVITPAENATVKITELSQNGFVLNINQINLIHSKYEFSFIKYLENLFNKI